jgi:hypothetical protein
LQIRCEGGVLFAEISGLFGEGRLTNGEKRIPKDCIASPENQRRSRAIPIG